MQRPPPSQVRGVIWDIGNVIVRWDPRTLYDKAIADPARRERFLTSVCTMDWHIAHDLGVTFADNRAPLMAQHPEFTEEILDWERRWPEMFSGAIPETEAAIEALAVRGVPQFGLSNMSHEVLGQITALSPSFRHLGDIVISAETAIMKPDPRIYAQACERFGLKPEQAVFVDDSARNIAGAAALGFHVHHFTDPAALWPTLEGLGLL
jgi:2-haloacid dehalogenase/putative hydrolase of the HAD superfamily